MNNNRLSEEQKKELTNAISKLSEEEQAQIAAAGCFLNDEVCQKLRQRMANGELGVAIAYGAHYPHPITALSLEEIKKAWEEWKDKHRKLQDDVLKNPENSNENTI